MRKLLFILMALTFPLVGLAKKKPAAELATEGGGKMAGRVYLFGASQMLTDSVVFLTGICEVDSVALERKTGFLPYRSEFSLQLKEYLEGKLHLKHQTACVYFSTDRKHISKQFYRLKKRYLDNPNMKIKMIDDGQFAFRHPMDAYVQEDEEKK